MEIEQDNKWAPHLDAVTAAPESHIVLLENEQVRVLKVIIEPGHKEPPHTHQWPSIFIHVNSTPLKYYGAGGELEFETDGTAKAHSTEWLAPEGLHAVENIGDKTYEALRIELKQSKG